MRNSRDNTPVTVAQLAEFDEIIDTRSEAEYAEDHIPGAINCPVLTNDERARIGTLYKQVSSFDAKKAGAALVSRNIAHHLETVFAQRPRNWRPLVYCWRGGGRSGAMTHVLQAIGWRAARLDGGYKRRLSFGAFRTYDSRDRRRSADTNEFRGLRLCHRKKNR